MDSLTMVLKFYYLLSVKPSSKFAFRIVPSLTYPFIRSLLIKNFRCYYGEMPIIKFSEHDRNEVKYVKIDWAADKKPIGRTKDNVPVRERKGEKMGETEELTYFNVVQVLVTAHPDTPGKLLGSLRPSKYQLPHLPSN